MIGFLKKTSVILTILIVLSFLVRTYKLSDWLYFQADQVRNVNHVHEVLENGWRGLPLLGPKAGGTDFHLGPLSYYLEIIPALFFGLPHPVVVVYSNLFFILLSILLVYYFLRQGFSRLISLQVTTLYAFSYVVIQYSRFSWNPNSLLFWGLLFIIATYKIFQSAVDKRGRWLLVLALSYGFVSQLHTTALIGYPAVFLFYWLYQRIDLQKVTTKEGKVDKNYFRKILFLLKSIFEKKSDKLLKINWRYWLGAVLILLVLFSPVIYYDWQNHGSNLHEFQKALLKKSVNQKTIFQKLERELKLMGEYYTLNLFSLNYKELGWRTKTISLSEILGLTLLFFGWLSFWVLRPREKIATGKDFFVLNIIWWAVFLILFLPISYQLNQMRFWFITFLIPYLALSGIFSWLQRKSGLTVWVLWMAILVLNLTAVGNWYWSLEQENQKDYFWRTATSGSLQQYDRITYREMEEVVDYMTKNANNQKICFKAPSKYRASYRYILKHQHPNYLYQTVGGKISDSDFSDCVLYVIQHNNPVLSERTKLKEDLFVNSSVKVGPITVFRVDKRNR